MTDAKDTHTHDPVARLELGGVVLVGPPRGTLFLCESGRLFSVLFRYIYNSHTQTSRCEESRLELAALHPRRALSARSTPGSGRFLHNTPAAGCAHARARTRQWRGSCPPSRHGSGSLYLPRQTWAGPSSPHRLLRLPTSTPWRKEEVSRWRTIASGLWRSIAAGNGHMRSPADQTFGGGTSGCLHPTVTTTSSSVKAVHAISTLIWSSTARPIPKTTASEWWQPCEPRLNAR